MKLPAENIPSAGEGLLTVLWHRVIETPFNAVALLIFACAIVHTLLAGHIRRWSEARWDHNSGRGRLWHFLSEVEVVFGLWVVALAVAMAVAKGWPAVVDYLGNGVEYTEPLFVIVIMTMAASRPVLDLAERVLRMIAQLGAETPAAWWVTLLAVAPLLGSLITEPAAMTIAASLLGRRIFALRLSARLRYATLGLLFVNISVGGTLTHFAAPPVLMVARAWDWDLVFMLTHFGWRAVLGIALATTAYFAIFRRELSALSDRVKTKAREISPPPPGWVIAVHVGFMAFTVWQAHHPALFIAGFLFFLAFVNVTKPHQNPIALREPVLVGVFLAGLVVHGGMQGWWIVPVMQRLGETPLFLGAGLLTAFNDNAAITYLASLVPNLSAAMKFAVVAGAVTGGGLTIIANAPNPAGQAILGRHFENGVAPLKLAAAALLPTVLVGLCFVF